MPSSIPRDIDLIYVGCSLGIGNFQNSPNDSNMQQKFDNYEFKLVLFFFSLCDSRGVLLQLKTITNWYIFCTQLDLGIILLIYNNLFGKFKWTHRVQNTMWDFVKLN